MTRVQGVIEHTEQSRQGLGNIGLPWSTNRGKGLSIKKALMAEGKDRVRLTIPNKNKYTSKMMPTTRGIKNLGNKGCKNDEGAYGRTGRPKDREEHIGVLKGFLYNIFGINR
jgi:hypothetical protein